MTDISLHNTLTGGRESFRPIDPGNVRMYVCGPTVYDRAHVGNARPVVAFDVLFRLLRHVYGEGAVTYARNVTDVDDKIVLAAKANGEGIADLTERTLSAFHEDMAALKALPPTFEPRATGHVDDMVAMVRRLVDAGHAYVAHGNVLFEVATDPGYGRLAKRDAAEALPVDRVPAEPWKKAREDFALWKPSSADEPGWDSPWGRGRPGWHIECSAMARRYLGGAFDVHAGGQDLIFPHHENEIAQSACCGDASANVWLHNGHVMVDGAKMAKSAGNFTTVRDLLDRGHAGEVVRFALLSAHYRAPLDLSAEKMDEAKARLDRFYRALEAATEIADVGPSDGVLAALGDDLNTPAALADLHESARRALLLDGASRAEAAGRLRAGGRLLGLLEDGPGAWFRGEGGHAEDIERLVAERSEARARRDFETADRIRDRLAERGVTLEDRPDGSAAWRFE